MVIDVYCLYIVKDAKLIENAICVNVDEKHPPLVVTSTPSLCHLVLCDPPGRCVASELLQRVDDLATGAHGDPAGEDKIQMRDTGILRAEEEGRDDQLR